MNFTRTGHQAQQAFVPIPSKRQRNEIPIFNVTIEDSVSSAKKELSQLAPVSDKQKDSLKRAVGHLELGMKSIATRQKAYKGR